MASTSQPEVTFSKTGHNQYTLSTSWGVNLKFVDFLADSAHLSSAFSKDDKGIPLGLKAFQKSGGHTFNFHPSRPDREETVALLAALILRRWKGHPVDQVFLQSELELRLHSFINAILKAKSPKHKSRACRANSGPLQLESLVSVD